MLKVYVNSETGEIGQNNIECCKGIQDVWGEGGLDVAYLFNPALLS